ncbi:bifunctional oligoribonuclease/PAP phosphatase NrnA [Akkermansiaceae bacterium]|nr:bifunctional oligoribonuclease/PAP phosphatase NrnA [Akkermansiaceae bacterium]
MSENVSFDQIGQVLQDHDTFAVISHVRPDGDAIGSILALGHALERMGKKVRFLNQDGCPESLLFLRGSEKVEVSAEAGELQVDVAICLDTAAKTRVGEDSFKVVEAAGTVVNIDHHVSNPGYGDFNYVDDSYPATGQIVYDLLKHLDLPISEVSRDSIYVATSTDTGSFQYPGTTQATYEMAADLVSLGLDVGQINQLTYDNQPYRKVELMRSLLNTLERSDDGQIAWCHLKGETKAELSLIDDDTEGMIDILRSIQGVIVAVFFEELGGGEIRVSMRSKDRRINCSEICGIFGGGGHALAAGIRMAGPIEDAQSKVLSEVQSQLSVL